MSQELHLIVDVNDFEYFRKDKLNMRWLLAVVIFSGCLLIGYLLLKIPFIKSQPIILTIIGISLFGISLIIKKHKKQH